jgi:murein L,D-transpeptidase YafK
MDRRELVNPMKRLLLLSLALAMVPSCKGKGRAKEAEQRIGERMEHELADKTLEMGSPVFIRAFKEERELELYVESKSTGKFELFRTYPIAAASGVLGPKLAEGDGQVPEGFYFAGSKAMNPNSTYHLSFNIGYPNEYDRAHGRTGSFIMIHGSNVSIGCLAMTDEKIEEIYTLCQAALDNGQPFFRIHIFPFRMTPERMAKAAGNPHLPFWENLETGYGLFERNKIPPNASVRDKEYVFE